MGRKGKRTGTKSESSFETQTKAESQMEETDIEKSVRKEGLIMEVREMYHALIGEFRVKRKLRSRSGKFSVSSLLKSDLKKRLQTSIESLSSFLSNSEVYAVLSDFGDGLAEVLGAEIPTCCVKDELSGWISEASTLMSSMGQSFQSLCKLYLPAGSDLGRDFKLSLLEKANKMYAEKVAPSGCDEEKMCMKRKAAWLAPKPMMDDPKMRDMSLDQLVNFITDDTAPVPPSVFDSTDDFRLEISKFRKRLETIPSPPHRLTPSLSPSFLSRLSAHCTWSR